MCSPCLRLYRCCGDALPVESDRLRQPAPATTNGTPKSEPCSQNWPQKTNGTWIHRVTLSQKCRRTRPSGPTRSAAPALRTHLSADSELPPDLGNCPISSLSSGAATLGAHSSGLSCARASRQDDPGRPAGLRLVSPMCPDKCVAYVPELDPSPAPSSPLPPPPDTRGASPHRYGGDFERPVNQPSMCYQRRIALR